MPPSSRLPLLQATRLDSVLAEPSGGRGAEALYIHIPFCAHKCHYCDFYSFVDTRDRQGEFSDALARELAWLARWADAGGPLKSVFIGGGTPSLLAIEHWGRLLEAMHEHFRLDRSTEFSVECNPESVTADLVRVLADAGVNRISMGAQSFHERHLVTLERLHTPGNVEKALAQIADAGIARRSLDLIFAIPGQTLAEWEADLRRALALPIEHLSCYSLTYEPNTAMTKRMLAGEFEQTPEDLDADMYEAAVAACRAGGLERYEVSNFARDGAECAHNLAYWRSEDWLAAGPSASGHLAGHRWKNVPRLTDWMQGVMAGPGASPIVDHEPPDARRELADRIMMGLRVRDGLDRGAIESGARELRALDAVRMEIEMLRDEGVLSGDEGRISLTERGYALCDGAAARLIAVLSC